MGSLMRALGKGVASAASGISERAGKQLDSQLEETRRKRLAEYAIAAEDKAYSKGQERRKAELSDPNSAWSMEQKLIKENAGMETITDAEGNVLQRRKGSSDAYTQAQVNRDGLLTGVKSGTKKPTDKKYNFGGVELTAPQLFKAFEAKNKAASDAGSPTQTFPEFVKSLAGEPLRTPRPELLDAWREENPDGTHEEFLADVASRGYDGSKIEWTPTPPPAEVKGAGGAEDPEVVEPAKPDIGQQAEAGVPPAEKGATPFETLTNEQLRKAAVDKLKGELKNQSREAESEARKGLLAKSKVIETAKYSASNKFNELRARFRNSAPDLPNNPDLKAEMIKELMALGNTLEGSDREEAARMLSMLKRY